MSSVTPRLLHCLLSKFVSPHHCEILDAFAARLPSPFAYHRQPMSSFSFTKHQSLLPLPLMVGCCILANHTLPTWALAVQAVCLTHVGTASYDPNKSWRVPLALFVCFASSAYLLCRLSQQCKVICAVHFTSAALGGLGCKSSLAQR